MLNALEKRLQSLEQAYNKNSSPQTENEITLVRTDIDEIITEKTNGMIIRSKAQWYEEGEKPTKYFLNLEKRNYNNKVINRIQSPDNNFIETKKDILDEIETFYQTLYSSKAHMVDRTTRTETETIFLRNRAPKLSYEEK